MENDLILVPREPTEAMNEAGCIAAMECRIRETKALKAVVEKLGGAPAFMSQQGAEAWRAMLSAAPAPPQPQGAERKLWLWKNFVDGRPEYWAFDNPYPCYSAHGDPMTLGEPCGYAIFKGSELSANHSNWSESDVLSAIARSKPVPPPHPQPSGNGLSEITDEMVEAAASGICAVYNSPIPVAWEDTPPAWKDKYLRMARAAILAARAVEARVRSQPVQQGGGDFSISAEEKHKTIAAICEEVEHCTLPAGAIMTDKQVRHFRMYEAARRAFTAATFLQPPHPPTPTDEWRRAVEACAKVCETAGADWHDAGYDHKEYAAAYLAEQIRALSPTKPEHKPIAHAYHSRIKDGACTDCGQPKADHR